MFLIDKQSTSTNTLLKNKNKKSKSTYVIENMKSIKTSNTFGSTIELK